MSLGEIFQICFQNGDKPTPALTF